MNEYIKLIDKVSTMSDEELDAIVKAAMVIAALGPVLSILGSLFQTIASIITVLKSVKGVVDLVITVVQGGSATIATIAGGIGAIIAGLILAVKNFIDMWKDGWDIIKTILYIIIIFDIYFGSYRVLCVLAGLARYACTGCYNSRIFAG